MRARKSLESLGIQQVSVDEELLVFFTSILPHFIFLVGCFRYRDVGKVIQLESTNIGTVSSVQKYCSIEDHHLYLITILYRLDFTVHNES